MAAKDGRVVVITGASGGIGAALARELGGRGDRLVLAARRREALQAVAGESGEARAVVTDVTRRADVERLRDAALEAYGRVDAWVNNAGRGITRLTLDLTDDEFDEMMLVNVKSALYGMQAIVPYFKERGRGHVVNVSSFLGRVPYPTFRSAYNAAKHALNALTANARMDVHATHPDVHISLLVPGVVTTDFARNAVGGRPAAPVTGARLQPQTPEEVAGILAGLLDAPRAEVFTNPAHPEIQRRYYADVEAYEAALGAPAPPQPLAPARG